ETGPVPVKPDSISEFNRMVLKNLALDPDVVPGGYRTKSVAVGPYVGAPAEDVPYLVAETCKWLESSFEPPQNRADMRIVYAIVRAVLAHLQFEWIHPFGDGNGRTGRLVEFHLLVSSGVPFPAAHLLSNHYNQTRSEYYRQLHLASVSGGDVLPFVEYAVQGLVDGLRGQIERVQAEQMEVMWENYVHQKVPGVTSTQERRRALVFELTRLGQPVPRRALMEITVDLREAYADKTPKTLTRDLNFLREIGLLVLTSKGWTANRDLVRGFLPEAVVAY
ncbi:MAG: Fic family protein, partial [Actinomycetota bacterium]